MAETKVKVVTADLDQERFDDSLCSQGSKVDRRPAIGGRKRGRENTEENPNDDVVESQPKTRTERRPAKKTNNYAGVTLVADVSFSLKSGDDSGMLSSQGLAKSPRDISPSSLGTHESQATLTGTQPTVIAADDIRGTPSPMERTPPASGAPKGKGVAAGEKLPADASYEELQDYNIPFERLQFSVPESEASVGAYGAVRRAILLPGGAFHQETTVAVKTLKTGRTTVEKLERIFKRELLVLAKIRHPHIIEFIGFHISIQNLNACFVMGWAAHGDVFKYLNTQPAEPPNKIRLIAQVADALSYLHSKNITHGDIKAQNVLINDKLSAQLCDFGLAQLQDDPEFPMYEGSSQFAGSVRWCSPEFLTEGVRNPAQDVWAWAWFVWEILTGLIPYHNVAHEGRVVFTIMASGQSAFPDFGKYSEFEYLPQLCELLPRCWEKEVSRRVKIDDCLTALQALL